MRSRVIRLSKDKSLVLVAEGNIFVPVVVGNDIRAAKGFVQPAMDLSDVRDHTERF
ncbi:MAG: hypothetical protein AB1626_04015 [Candidatus Micrarchaeota archaeon]